MTNSQFEEGGFEQFRLAISQMRKTMPNTYKTTESVGTMKSYGMALLAQHTIDKLNDTIEAANAVI